MSFGAPEWLWGLVAIPILALLFLRAERRSAGRLREFVSPRLLAQLGATVSRFRRSLRFALLLTGLALAFLSLAKPRWGYTYEDVKRKGLDLIIAVDTSRSMLANDVPPNRLQRVKLAAQDLINELRGDRVGLIAFAGRAFLQAPLTIDYDAAAEALNELDTNIIPEGGTNISEAINLSTKTFGTSAVGNRALIIFTDGEELAGDAVKFAKSAADAGVRIFTVGVGTSQGSLIPLPAQGGGSSFVKDKDGQVVKSKLDEKRLREIAESTGGIFLPLANGPATMQQLYAQGLGKLQAGDIDARTSRQPIERYQWPLAAALVALSASVLIGERSRRRSSVAAVSDRRTRVVRARNDGPRPPLQGARATSLTSVFLLAVVTSAHAAAPGLEEYRAERFNEAYERFQQTLKENPDTHATDKIQFDSGAAAYKMKDYGKALQSFSQALLSPDQQLQSRSHYNLGNTLYQRGEVQKKDEEKLTDWTNALQHYDQTLKIEPENKEAKENSEFVKNKIEELKKKQAQPPTPTPTPSPSPSPDNKKDQKKSEQEQDKNQQQKQGGKGDEKEQDSQDQTEPGTDGQKAGPSPSPSPQEKQGASPSPSPGQSPESQGNTSPSPSPSGPSPSPSAGDGDEAPSPSPSPGEGDADGAGSESNSPTPAPSPSGTPQKKMAGEVKGASEDQSPQDIQEGEGAEAVEDDKMSPQQAERLLRSMRAEEQQVRLDERKAARRVYNDW